PFFRTLQEAFGVERMSLEIPGRGARRDAHAGPEGRWARVDRRDSDDGDAPARFVLVTGGEPGNEPGTLEVAMLSTRNRASRLRIGRDEPFDETETLSIQALGGVASLALDAPREWRERREVALWTDGAPFAGLVGNAPAMREAFAMIARVAPTQTSVLLLGESGTGKELAARAIHDRSQRSEGPFVAINCPSIPRELIEAELFGHEKGAFTGATAMRPGKVEVADGGTLFLDEVGDMEPATQVRLLRFLEEREFQRVGGRETRRVDVRILAATSRDLTAEVARGAFREDLYYRLNVVPLRMPSLRERREDVATLAAHFLKEPRRLSSRALDVLMKHDWPGNVRELRNAIEYAATVGSGDVLDESHLPDSVRSAGGAPEAMRVGGTWDLHSGETLEARLQEVEAALIRTTLESTDWNQSAAARRLGVTETKVRNRMKQYGIRRPGDATGGAS
ncbi:MAG: sigma-54-dependent Fis family transcriptional regulator, partial [Gemmatimonadetes bacterium]|nr:sigma-54-dependent Fis family transcriptional regulator [Gemmatimonadota bacterium]